MKLLSIFTITLIILFVSPNFIIAQPESVQDLNRPYIDSGEGYGVNPGDTKKSSSEIFEDLINIFFGGVKRNSTGNTNNDSDSGSMDNNTTTSPIPSPSIYITQPVNNGTIPSLPSNSNEATFASTITSLIHQDCTTDGVGVVNKKNTVLSQSLLGKPTCLTKVKGVMNPQGISEIESSVTAFYNLQCVGCVRAMAKALNKPYNGGGNAKNHIGQQVSGYDYIKNEPDNFNDLVEGSIGISGEGTYGHIFYIAKVHRDTSGNVTAYTAFECNYGPAGYVRNDKNRAISQKISATDNRYYLAGWQKPL